jgi:hypothetical protein
MLEQWPMAALASDVSVKSRCFLLEDVTMTVLACPMARIRKRTRGDLGDSVSAVVTVTAEATRDQVIAKQRQNQEAEEEDQCHPEEVL